MGNNVEITQKASIDSQATQVGIQNNINGISAQSAIQITINLFLDNFPKLQEEDKNVAKERAKELCEEIINKLSIQGKNDFSEFLDPDMQFVLNKAQQAYARMGTKDLLELLSNIVVHRTNYNSNQYMKILLDESVEIAKSLLPAHLNYLSLIFFCKHVKFSEINSIEGLKQHFEYICSKCPVPDNIHFSYHFLQVMRLLILKLGKAVDYCTQNYGFEEDAVQKILPEMLESIPADCGLSPIGIILAIINANNKTNYKFNFENWIKPL